jgi:hypothetical protein
MSGKAIVAGPIGVTQPRNTDALPEFKFSHARTRCIHATDDFVARNVGQFGPRQIAINRMQVRAAYAAGTDLDANFIGTGQRVGALGQL